MPYKDPKLQENLKPADQFGNRDLADQLNALNHVALHASGSNLLADAGRTRTAPVHRPVSALNLDDGIYKQVVIPKIKPPEDMAHATEADKAAFARRIFDAIAVGGTIGIVYDFNSDSRMTKSPDEVLTKVGGAYRADCDELAYTFLAIAKKAGLDIKSFQFVELTFNITGPTGKRTEDKHAAVIQMDGGTFILELTERVDGFSSIPDASLDSLRDFYRGRTISGTQGVVTNIISMTPRTTETEIEASFHAERANSLLRCGKILDAISEYETVLKLDRKYEGVADKLVELYFAAADAQKGFTEKEAYYKRAVEVAPESYRANFQLSMFYITHTRYEQAMTYFEKVAEMEPTNTTILNNLLFCCNKLRKFDEQIKYGERLLQLEADSSIAYTYMTIAYVEKAKAEYGKPGHGEAQALFRTALEYYEKGIAHAKQGSGEQIHLTEQKGEIDRYLRLMH